MIHLGRLNSKALIKFLPTQSVTGFSVSALSFDAQISVMLQWAQARLSKVVCVSNVHMLMEGHWHPEFAQVLAEADLLTPDGMPLVWLMSWLRGQRQERVAGMDILLALCQRAQSRGVQVFFLGSTPEILKRIRQRLAEDFPDLTVAGMEALPFRPLSPSEDAAVVQRINESGTGIVFVSLGCPKQERWMHQHRGQIQAVMIGVGGVFPVYAGIKKWAPTWIQKAGMEWCYRLAQEPGRLWKRYITTIPPFVWLAIKQILKSPEAVNPSTMAEDERTIVCR